jgi:DNA helicase HerA-like ATPase
MTSRAVIPDPVLESHLALLGKTGSGKSNAAVILAERLIDKKHRVCIVDPTDRYWGLRLSPDGRSPSGYEPVIFGGQHADLPLEAGR